MFNLFQNKYLLVISFLLAIATASAAYYSISYKDVEPDIEGALRAKATPGYLEKNILEAIAAENFDDVAMYQNLADFLNIKLNPTTIEEIEKHNSLYEKSLRDAKDFTYGFATGTSENSVAMAGSIASDMTPVGDLRDLFNEGSKFVQDEPYDKVTMSIAAVGVGLTASQYVSAGATTPLKIGASTLKAAKKAGKLSKSFLKYIGKKLTKTVDMKLLKKVDFSSISKLKGSASKVVKSLNFTHIKNLFGDVNKIKNNTSLMDTVDIMKYVNKPKDLGKIVKLSDKFKSNTKAVLKILGKGALHGSVKVLHYTTKLITQMAMFLFSSLMFLLALGTKLFALSSARRMVAAI